MEYVLGGIVIILAGWALVSYLAVRNIETPRYTVTEVRDGYEIREYAPHIVAETVVNTESARGGMNTGFRIIADYIFGNNTGQEKIAMTAPVLEERGASEKIAMTAPVLETKRDESTRTVAFVLPSEYTMDTLPTPNNDQVHLREVPGRTVAATRFTWYATEARVAKKKAVLLQKREEDAVTITGTPQGAFYNPPLSMPLLRRNEILVPIE
jgi:hypothetical protein